MPLLILFLTVVPLTELYLLFRIAELVGFLPTVGFTILTAALGSALARRQALRVWGDWSASLQEMRSPTQAVVEGLLILIGGVLLLTPGFLTDFLGFALLIPWTRQLFVKPIRRKINQHIDKLRVVRAPSVNRSTVERRDGHVFDTTYETLDD